MKINLGILLRAWLVAIFFIGSTLVAEEKIVQMEKIRQAFASLQPFLANQQAFESEANHAKVLDLLKDLKQNFHTVLELKGSSKSTSGFEINLSIISNILTDVAQRYEEGKTSYAYWRVRNLSSNCISCHAQYNISAIHRGDEQIEEVSHFSKGEYYFATRQLEKASTEFKTVVDDPENDSQQMRALRRLLIIFIRLNTSPDQILRYFEDTSIRLHLPLADKGEIEEWIKSLRRWRGEKVSKASPVKRAGDLIALAVSKDEGIFVNTDEVSLLRAVAILHPALEQGLNGEERSRALFLTGYAYSLLTTFFINELPEIYLEQCILEFPGSSNAKRAYQAYKDKVTLDYSGISDSDVPDELSARLKELYDKAYSIPVAPNKI